MHGGTDIIRVLATQLKLHDRLDITHNIVGLWMENHSAYDYLSLTSPFQTVPPQFVIEINLPDIMYRLLIPTLREPEKLIAISPVIFTQVCCNVDRVQWWHMQADTSCSYYCCCYCRA
jgi:hypothetical protein